MTIPKRYEPFWQAFAETQAVDPTPRFLEAFYFDDNEASANGLAALVPAGRKRATASLLWAYKHDQARIACVTRRTAYRKLVAKLSPVISLRPTPEQIMSHRKATASCNRSI